MKSLSPEWSTALSRSKGNLCLPARMRLRKEVFGWSGKGKHQINGDDSLILEKHCTRRQTALEHSTVIPESLSARQRAKRLTKGALMTAASQCWVPFPGRVD